MTLPAPQLVTAGQTALEASDGCRGEEGVGKFIFLCQSARVQCIANNGWFLVSCLADV